MVECTIASRVDGCRWVGEWGDLELREAREDSEDSPG